ncbi:hypothetical protein B0T20DRAFT_370716 [Sordaria brevicollis]|uniref:Glucose-methanol-choline oxidoreductase N-terminal domain-containing protein n=1 Tax=Sordaria brevicollis TaxID=83679 RepID=A0AAE0UFI4_SORBR|nr:hypothetical protein B0T20DRAFT_370716 [Sordaria brevicollis]
MWPFTSSYPTVRPDDIHDQTFDYVIVGGGTAGCVLASRLSETPNVSVLLLEKGQICDNFLSRIPLLSQNYEFPFLQSVLRMTQRDPYNGRPTELWAAEALGGTTRINALLWTRGWPGNYISEDVRGWFDDDWTWEKIEPYFKKVEEVVKPRKPQFDLGCIPFVEEAARRVGLPVGQGVNDAGVGPQGCFVMDQTVDGNGQRMSAYKAWLPPHVARERKERLKICVGVVASKLLLSKSETETKARVTGVQLRRGDREYTVKARREVIVCAGAICSPQLLMLSGIGPYGDHKRLGIPLIVEHEILGKYADHLSVPIMMELPRKHTLHCLGNVFVFFWHLLLYVFFGKGLLANGTTSRSIFVCSRAIDKRTMTLRHVDNLNGHHVPDVEIMINPVNCLPAPVNIGNKSLFTWYTTLSQQWSSGHVSLASNDPMADPEISDHHMSYEEERTMRTAVRFTMRLAEEFAKNTGYPHQAKLVVAPGMDLEYLDSLYRPKKGFFQTLWAWARKKRPTEYQRPVPYRRFKHIRPEPGDPYSSAALSKRFPNIEEEKKKRPAWQTVSDEEISDYMDRVVASAQHISSSCRMRWVVNERLKVIGVQNLRVADASVFPRIPSGHTMAPVMMVAERCAEFVKVEWEGKKRD